LVVLVIGSEVVINTASEATFDWFSSSTGCTHLRYVESLCSRNRELTQCDHANPSAGFEVGLLLLAYNAS
jgi:hypothetical protein